MHYVKPRHLPMNGASQEMAMAATAEPGSEDELEAMRDLFGKDFAMLAELYLGDSPKRIAVLRDAAAAGDAGQAARVAHSLGGSCASIGAPGLALLCQTLELDCRNGRMDRLDTQLQAIEAAYAKLESRLRAMLQA